MAKYAYSYNGTWSNCIDRLITELNKLGHTASKSNYTITINMNDKEVVFTTINYSGVCNYDIFICDDTGKEIVTVINSGSVPNDTLIKMIPLIVAYDGESLKFYNTLFTTNQAAVASTVTNVLQSNFGCKDENYLVPFAGSIGAGYDAVFAPGIYVSQNGCSNTINTIYTDGINKFRCIGLIFYIKEEN